MWTPFKKNSSRNERVRTFLPYCCCDSGCCNSYKPWIMTGMDVKFRYLLDPLFLFAFALYIVNKLLLFSFNWWGSKFVNSYLNDFLLIPVLIPIILYVSKRLNCRKYSFPPMFVEIIIPLVIWSIAFEFIGPFYVKKGISDPFDVLAYCLGGFFSWLFWNRNSLVQRQNISCLISKSTSDYVVKDSYRIRRVAGLMYFFCCHRPFGGGNASKFPES